MNLGQFLRRVWPSQGFYCIAHPYVFADDTGKTVQTYSHKVFDTIGEAVTYCHEVREVKDVFFAVLSLAQDKVWNPEKIDRKTNLKGAFEVRTQSNSSFARVAFFDIDVGANDPKKYPDQTAAKIALATFIQDTGLPVPTILSSGGGLHVYWHFDRDVVVAEWREFALHMQQLALHQGLRVDQSRTTDSASVLRVLETFNYKLGADKRRSVVCLAEGDQTPFPALQLMVRDQLIKAGVQPGVPQAKYVAPPVSILGTQAAPEVFGPAPTIDEQSVACAQVKEIVASYADVSHPHHNQLDNNAWFQGVVNTIRFVEQGPDILRAIVRKFPRTNSDLEEKLAQLSAKAIGPAKCETIAKVLPWGDTPCKSCVWFQKGKNPLIACRLTTPAPPPSIPQIPVGAVVPPLPSAQALQSLAVLLIPNPPLPYERLASGGIGMTSKDKDGNSSKVVIYDCDLFPLRRVCNAYTGVEKQEWRAILPRSGAKDFPLDASTLCDLKKLGGALFDRGIYIKLPDMLRMQDYMTAYIKQLQLDNDAEEQQPFLGWADNYKKFVMPDLTYHTGGTPTKTTLTSEAKAPCKEVYTRGTVEEQVKALKFFSNSAYFPQQFIILASLGSPLFHHTKHFGAVVNLSGVSGSSKTTGLEAAASMWGNSQKLALNGTGGGATPMARAQRANTYNNLPLLVDEVTGMDPEELQTLVMNATQAAGRARLTPHGAEKEQNSSDLKSAILISTSNSSMHSVLGEDNAAGTAGSMRVFEIETHRQNVHTKAQADEFRRSMGANFGHIGPRFIQFVMQHADAVAKRVYQVVEDVDARAGLSQAERFHSAVIATVQVTAEIAKALGLLDYDADKLTQWAIDKQVPETRGMVASSYRDNVTVLTDYIAERAGNIIVIENTPSGLGVNTSGISGQQGFALNNPTGSLLGHHDRRLSQLHILKKGFSDYCSKSGLISARVINDLCRQKIILNPNHRRVLGAGTQHANGQSWVFTVDMAHEAIGGSRPTLLATTGQAVGPPTGNLKVVP